MYGLYKLGLYGHFVCRLVWLVYGPACMAYTYSAYMAALFAGWYGLCTASGWVSKLGPDSASSSLLKALWNQPPEVC
jgi:hypothetical protein